MPNPITPAMLDEMDALAASATPGPCPFCGKILLEIKLIAFSGWIVECQSCGGNGLATTDKDLAIIFWNSRPIESALSTALRQAWAENEKLKAAFYKAAELAVEIGDQRNYEHRHAECDFSDTTGKQIAEAILKLIENE
jgi:hypothetical protein